MYSVLMNPSEGNVAVFAEPDGSRRGPLVFKSEKAAKKYLTRISQFALASAANFVPQRLSDKQIVAQAQLQKCKSLWFHLGAKYFRVDLSVAIN